jgi:energy-coupling factor transporter transmembrane protein EcfT
VIFLLHPETSPERMLVLLLRAGLSALSLVLLLSTTTFADVLRVLAVLLPRTLAAALAVLYRSLFILLRSSAHTMEAARLRGVRGGAGAMVGGLLLHAFERTENVACVMHVRGVDAPDPDRADAFRPRPFDLVPLAAAGAVLALSLSFRGAP